MLYSSVSIIVPLTTIASMIGLIVFCFTLGSIRRTTCPSRWIKPKIGGFSFSSVPRPQAPFRRRRRPARPFFLGRQSLLLEGALFEGGEVCRRIAAEAGPWRFGAVSSGLGFRAIWQDRRPRGPER